VGTSGSCSGLAWEGDEKGKGAPSGPIGLGSEGVTGRRGGRRGGGGQEREERKEEKGGEDRVMDWW